SVREVLRRRRAHCIEGAMLAACALWVHGEPPLLMDLRAERDYDHVVVLFRLKGHWVAISKTNPPVLRWRDPVYRSLRELAMSYLHEYANDRAQKTLRSYSRPFDLRGLDPEIWVTSSKNCWDVGEAVDEIRHYPLVTKRQARGFRLRDRDAAECFGELHRVVDAAVQAEAPDRIVDVRGVASEEHPALAERLRHALVHPVDVPVRDQLHRVVLAELSQPPAHRAFGERFVVRLVLPRGKDRAPVSFQVVAHDLEEIGPFFRVGDVVARAATES